MPGTCSHESVWAAMCVDRNGSGSRQKQAHMKGVSRNPACSASSLLWPILVVRILLVSHLFQSSLPVRDAIMPPFAPCSCVSLLSSVLPLKRPLVGEEARGLNVPWLWGPDWPSSIKGVDSPANESPIAVMDGYTSLLLLSSLPGRLGGVWLCRRVLGCSGRWSLDESARLSGGGGPDIFTQSGS